MAVNHALHTPFKATELDADELQAGLVHRVPYCVADAAEAAALDLTNIAQPPLALQLGIDLFAYDETDTVTVHDGVTCLVTSDGKRFKNDGTRVKGTVIWSVNDADLTAPPASPAIGDAYLLPAAPTGAWAAHGKHVGVYTERGWVFPAPRSGMLVYVEDEDAYRRYNGTVWVSGFGSAAIADGALTPAKMLQAYGERVETETATPPGSIPAEGTLYIVGASATGAWAGEDGNIARVASGAWVFDPAVEGMTVFNKAIGYNVSFKSGVWQRDLSAGLLIFKSAKSVGNSTTVDNTWTQFLSLGTRTGVSTSNRLIVTGVFDYIAHGGEFDIGLFIDSETSPRESRRIGNVTNLQRVPGTAFALELTVPDGAAHDVFIKAKTVSGTLTVERSEAYLDEVTG